MTKILKEELIKALASGDFISGQILGEQLGVSRMAISKHINTLSNMGLDVFRITGKGYKLAQPLNLLNQNEIKNTLSQYQKYNDIEVHTMIDSTNDYLMRRLADQNSDELRQGQVCIAEYQHAGRGRRGKQWISPFGSHIYLSMYWQLEQGLSAAMGLSLVTALAVSDAIKKLFDIKVQFKWPNDIYLDGVKMAGILIDLEGQVSGVSHSVIGIGLNLQMPEKSATAIDQPWTDLQSHSAKKIDRNKLCAALINCLIERLNSHQTQGLHAMVDEWHQQDIFFNKSVNLITGGRVTSGISRGINHQGALMLEVMGKVKPIYGGEVSLRAGY